MYKSKADLRAALESAEIHLNYERGVAKARKDALNDADQLIRTLEDRITALQDQVREGSEEDRKKINRLYRGMIYLMSRLGLDYDLSIGGAAQLLGDLDELELLRKEKSEAIARDMRIFALERKVEGP